VRKVESIYKDDTREEIITRIRRLYYPRRKSNFVKDESNTLKFDRLLPNAPNYEVVRGISPVGGIILSTTISVERIVSRDKLKDDNVFDILTAQADENAKFDNLSPYLVFSERDEMIDIGHMLLTLDALLHPGSEYPYSGQNGYKIPTIDPASWVADIGIGSVWLSQKLSGKLDDSAPQNIKTFSLPGSTPTQEEIDLFYKTSAPEPDIIGDVNGFGLFDKMRFESNNGKPLSQLLNEYYLPGDGMRSTSVKARWRTFSDDFQVYFAYQGRIEGTFNVNNLTEEQKNQWISRIDKFNNLFGDGGAKGVTIFFRKPDWTWKYTKAMFERFTTYVKEQLTNEKRTY
jgi:hypothetical protein